MLFFVSLLLCSPLNLWAYDFEVDGIYYNISGSEATVTYKTSSYDSYSESVIVPETVTYNSVTYPVTSIGDWAFQYCTGLTQITIPESVTSIGSGAFYDCWKLTSITIPEGVTSIGGSAFYGCTGLTEITSKNPTPPTINSYTFYGVDKINCILIVPTGCEKMYALADYWNEFYSANKVNDIYYIFSGSEAFVTYKTTDYNSYSGSIIVPETVTYNGAVYRVTGIGNSAFRDCTELMDVTLPNSIISIGNYAFDGCNSLTDITIPDNVTEIGDYAFSGCTGLMEITSQATTPPTIYSHTFEGVDKTECTPNVPTGCGEIYAQADYWSEFYSAGKVDGIYYLFSESEASVTYKTIDYNSYSGSIIVPETVTYGENIYRVTGIGSSAFRNCTGLTDVTLPNSITSIGIYAFYNCSNLTEITIPDNVTSIGSSAFYKCSGLTEVTLGSNVTSLGVLVFYNCTGLTEITSKTSTPPTIYSNTFSGVDKTSCILNVPTGCKSLYAQATYWKDFYTINEVDFTEESTGIREISMNAETVISFEAGAIVVQGENLPVSVYDLTGRLLRQETVQQEKRIDLPAGCYIVKAGNTTQKFLLGN
ncbi:MAG: leucine-rich repeat domain-containing protein [Porphyromonadaceae bacterium]|nr:leucine-rich repeat domain-containing protein [Porphyromonadaceae bacterium]